VPGDRFQAGVRHLLQADQVEPLNLVTARHWILLHGSIRLYPICWLQCEPTGGNQTQVDHAFIRDL
jgi:hypothetical protein